MLQGTESPIRESQIPSQMGDLENSVIELEKVIFAIVDRLVTVRPPSALGIEKDSLVPAGKHVPVLAPLAETIRALRNRVWVVTRMLQQAVGELEL